MPIMNACECKEKFDKILIAAIITLTIIYCAYANFTYLVFGTDLKHPFITEELNQEAWYVKFI